ncbi:MAG: hypothetical protein R3B96_19485 [Pirellulaceae bacterium]
MFGKGIGEAQNLWDEIEIEGKQETLGIYSHQDDTWLRLRLTEKGAARLAELASKQSSAWRGLGVSILHELLLPDLLGLRAAADAEVRPLGARGHRWTPEGRPSGSRRDGPNRITSSIPARRLGSSRIGRGCAGDQPSRRADATYARSTYFYPKLLSGMVFNSLGVESRTRSLGRVVIPIATSPQEAPPQATWNSRLRFARRMWR